MSSEGRLQDFELACELSGHDNEVRAVCSAPDGSLLSGGQDRLVRRWVNTGAGDAAPYAFVEAAVVPDHEHWVVCLLPLPAGAIAECPEGGFVTGSLDKTARIFALDGSCVRTLTGHTGGVISLAWTAAGDLLTGSWDGTARRWRVATGECVETLPGHENGVCVMELDGTDVLTGSTGRQQDDTVVGFQIRRWRAGREMQHITDHSAAVRCLIPVPGVGFASASNDGTVRVRDASGTVLQVLRSPDEPFILTACVLPTGELLSGGVDSVVRVWRDGAAAQEVQLPGTVWWLASLANGDFAVACADRTVRVFTRSPARMAPEEARAALREAVQRKATGAQQSVDVASLPDYADSERVRGSQEGQVHLFRRGDKAFAFRWSQAAGSWLEIGEVTGTAGGDSSGGGEAVDASTVGLAAGKQELGGQLYDMVVPVEMESTDGPAHLQLGFNVTENPYEVAERFLQQHGLPVAYMEQVARFVAQQIDSPAGRAALAASAGAIAQAGGAGAGAGGRRARDPFPDVGFVAYQSCNFRGLLSKIAELNQRLTDAGAPEALDAAGTGALTELAGVLQETSRYHATELPSAALPALRTVLLGWPVQDCFPGVDMLRMVITHPRGAQWVASEHGWRLLVDVLERVKAVEAQPVPRMLALRALANLALQGSTRALLLTRAEQILPACAGVAADPHPTVQQAIANVLTNYAVLLSDPPHAISADLSGVASQCAALAQATIPRVEAEAAKVALVKALAKLAAAHATAAPNLAEVAAALDGAPGAVGEAVQTAKACL